MPDLSSLSPAQRAAHASVAGLLAVEPATLALNATMISHPKWDSFAHLEILLFLQQEKGIEINEATLSRFSHLANILELF